MESQDRGFVLVPTDDREIARLAFSAPEWHSAADALFQATGVTACVMDLGSDESLAGTTPCAHCNIASEIETPSPSACFDSPPSPDCSSGRVPCRAGMPTLIAPVMRGSRPIAHVMVGGFVTSTRDRRRLWEILSAKSTKEDSVRLAVKSIPVVPRAEADGYLQVILACARAIVDSTIERVSAAERVEELRLFVSAGQQVITTENLDPAALNGIVEEAVALVGGEAGAVLRPVGGFFELVAHTESWRGSVGSLTPREGTASARAAATRRSVVARGGKGAAFATLSFPLSVAEKVLGVLEVRLPESTLPVSPERVARLDRFGRFIAIALQREEERARVERAMAGYTRLNELAAQLGGSSDIDAAAEVVSALLADSFEHQLAGVVLSSWGRDHAEVVVHGDVSSDDVEYVLSEVAGRDVASAPYATTRVNDRDGRILDGERSPGEWSLAAVELESGSLVVGYLFVARKDGGHYDATDRALLAGVSAHAGAAFGRVALFTRIRDDYAKTIAALSASFETGKHMTAGHTSRVMEYAMVIGEEMGLPFEDVEQLRFAGLLHDIGKTGLPTDLLLKPSKLTADELERVRAHAELGASIAEQIEFLRALTPVILHHHECWDGSGSPDGLSAEKIPLLSRVLAVADAYDAMTTKRAGGKKLTAAVARKELLAQSGTKLDPRVVEALLEALGKQALAGATGLLAPAEARGRPELPA